MAWQSRKQAGRRTPAAAARHARRNRGVDEHRDWSAITPRTAPWKPRKPWNGSPRPVRRQAAQGAEPAARPL